MQNDIEVIYQFQKQYLFKVLNNIPENRAYEKQLEGLNSAGWVLGHLCAEGIDVMNKFSIPHNFKVNWSEMFSYNAKAINHLDGLPSLADGQRDFDVIYSNLILKYKELSSAERESPPPTELLKGILPNTSTWFIHHLTTHLAVHIGNITTWKKIIGLKTHGY